MPLLINNIPYLYALHEEVEVTGLATYVNDFVAKGAFVLNADQLMLS